MAKAGRGDDQYMLRFPEGLRDRIKGEAEANGRSINSEIIARLSGEVLSNEAQETIRKLQEEISRLKGMNDALGRTVKAFVDHLSLSDEGKQLVLRKILEDEFISSPTTRDE